MNTAFNLYLSKARRCRY